MAVFNFSKRIESKKALRFSFWIYQVMCKLQKSTIQAGPTCIYIQPVSQQPTQDLAQRNCSVNVCQMKEIKFFLN